MNMHQLFTVGDEIYGYCDGLFGRDSYEPQICVMVTPEYAVFESKEQYAQVLNLSDRPTYLTPQIVAKWKERETA